ncbi:hypothetical protein IE53DRAFT_388229 [Violaceomyces palustris]|uniref:Uncharacterized protein n=1 Tax=Violaceomyces palustris TaxID=1673888 RepID=A0ACD0NUQ9_9BASI|nr:hypothetical protein IE53DRAFT_388229 [Violaceomyces palustris]
MATGRIREGIRPLYRSILHQARLLSHTWKDRTILDSHTYLARKWLEQASLATDEVIHLEVVGKGKEKMKEDPRYFPPALSSMEIRARKRFDRAKDHLRHLADANMGWPHAVRRALEAAYGRRGRLRREILNIIKPTPSRSTEEVEIAKVSDRKREVHPLLRALILSSHSNRGSAPKPAHFDWPPESILPPRDDANLKAMGKVMSRRREMNAKAKWLAAQMRKVIVPIEVRKRQGDRTKEGEMGKEERRDAGAPWCWLEKLENQAKSPGPGAFLPRRLRSEEAWHDEGRRGWVEGGGSGGRESGPVYLDRAREEARHFSSQMGYEPNRRRKPCSKTQGWIRGPRDYEREPRARRREYMRILAISPLVEVGGCESEQEGSRAAVREQGQGRAPPSVKPSSWARDTQRGIQACFPPPSPAVQVREGESRKKSVNVKRSRLSLLRINARGAASGSEGFLSAEEIEFLRSGSK